MLNAILAKCHGHSTTASGQGARHRGQADLQAMLNERRYIPREVTAQRNAKTNRIRREVRAVRRAARHDQIDKVLSAFKSLQKINFIQNNGRNNPIPNMTMTDGTKEHGRKGIADIFADFYEWLHE
eukprot:2953060-Pyramimonas_sp.AAC.1